MIKLDFELPSRSKEVHITSYDPPEQFRNGWYYYGGSILNSVDISILMKMFLASMTKIEQENDSGH